MYKKSMPPKPSLKKRASPSKKKVASAAKSAKSAKPKLPKASPKSKLSKASPVKSKLSKASPVKSKRTKASPVKSKRTKASPAKPKKSKSQRGGDVAHDCKGKPQWEKGSLQECTMYGWDFLRACPIASTDHDQKHKHILKMCCESNATRKPACDAEMSTMKAAELFMQ
jgi:hypothetical protein